MNSIVHRKGHLGPIFAFAALLASSPALSAQEILVAGFDSGVHRYDFATGVHLGDVGNINDPLGIVTGPDGHVYIAEEATDKVLRFDGTTFAFIDEFVTDDPNTPEDENGPLNGPAAVLFGEDGNLYVSSFANDRVLRYDGTSGAYIDTFVSNGSGGLNGPDAGMAWGPDGHLYVPSFFNRRVLKYDQRTGASLGAFVSNASGGLNRPRTIVFRPDGTALVSSEGSNAVLHYDADGNFLSSILGINYSTPTGLAVSPVDGNVYVSSVNVGNVRRFNGTDGSVEGVAVKVAAGSLELPVFLSFHEDPYLHLSRMKPGVTSAFNELEVSNATPSSVQVWMIGTNSAPLPLLACPHGSYGIQNPFFRLRLSNAAGISSIGATIGDDLLGVTIAFQVIEPVSCRVTNLVLQTLE